MVIAGKQLRPFPCAPHQPSTKQTPYQKPTPYATISQTSNTHHIITSQQLQSNTKMFPQPDAQTLSRNPQFAHLWKDLTTNKITRDGVSKSLFLDKNTVKVRETLKSKRTESAKGQVLKNAVRAVAFGEGEGGLVGEVSFDFCFMWKVW
jgi:hypothetical protein